MRDSARVVLVALGLVALTSGVRCVVEQPGVSVELVFEASSRSADGDAEVSGAWLTIGELSLVRCEERASLFDLIGPRPAYAHGDGSDVRWVGPASVDALGDPRAPLGLLSPPGARYCAVRVVVRPDEDDDTDPRLDPRAQRSIVVEGSFARADGSPGEFAVRSSAERELTLPLDPPLVLDQTGQRAAVSLRFEASEWANGMDFEGSSAGERQAALLGALDSTLKAIAINAAE